MSDNQLNYMNSFIRLTRHDTDDGLIDDKKFDDLLQENYVPMIVFIELIKLLKMKDNNIKRYDIKSNTFIASISGPINIDFSSICYNDIEYPLNINIKGDELFINIIKGDDIRC